MKALHQKICVLSGVVFLLLLILFFPIQVKAEGTSLSISPSLMRIEAKPPADVWTPFTISNTSDQPISAKNWL
jgi:hypothetical protein